MSCISLSLLVGLTATVASLAPAIAIALFLERSGSRLRGPVQAIVMMPLVLPPVVVGYLLLRLFSPRGIVGGALARIGTPVAFHWLGAVVAAAVVGFPLLVLQISLAVKGVEPNLERLSRSLGRGRLSTFLRVTLPLSWPGILAGFAIAFARGLGEFGATIVLAGRIPGETETIPLAIYAELDSPGGEERVRPLVIASMIICAGCVVIARALDRWHARRLELQR